MMFPMFFTFILSFRIVTLVTISGNEISEKIKQFKQSVQYQIYPNNSYVHKFIRDDLYAAQWLSVNKFNVDLAHKHFRKHLTWRNAEGMDSIHLENWADYPSDYPQFLNIGNESNPPVAEYWLSQWDIRHAVLTGQSRKLLRWNIYLLEMTQRSLYEKREKGNLTITSGIEIIDFEGFNFVQHGCPACTPFYINLSQLWETHYPKLWDRVLMLNVGPVFRTFLDMGRSFNYGRDHILELFTNKAEWMPVLNSEIGKNQRSMRYGGHIARYI